MSLDKIKQIVSSLNKTLENNEKLATQILAVRLGKANAMYPYDQTIGGVHRVIEKMAENKTLFIKKSEFKDLYKRMYYNGTKFAELFSDELGEVVELSGPSYFTRDDSAEIVEYSGDEVLKNALNSVFDPGVKLKMYSERVANNALKAVKAKLDVWNLTPTKLYVDEGNEKYLVIKADYETPKGLTSVYIPVDNNVISDVFIGHKMADFSKESLKGYILKNAGVKLNITGASILGVMAKAGSEKREITDVELALTKLKASREVCSDLNGIVGQKIAEEVKGIELPKSNEFQSFEDKFTSANGLAEFEFGDKVNTARNHIVRELLSFGHKNPQITVSKTDKNTIYYNVALAGRVGFTVPVKIADNKIVKPKLMLCNGSVTSFNRDAINELYVSNSSDYRAAAGACSLSAMRPSEVLKNLRDAMADGNTVKAEDALNVLAHCGDVQAYATGFQAYIFGLNGKVKEVVKCAHPIKNKTSEHPICSHTGLPVHKVYQDKDGNCRPLFRQGMDETYEGAVFNNSKIFG